MALSSLFIMLTIRSYESSLTHVSSTTLLSNSNFYEVLFMGRQTWAPEFHEPSQVKWGGDQCCPFHAVFVQLAHTSLCLLSSQGTTAEEEPLVSSTGTVFAVELWAQDNRASLAAKICFYLGLRDLSDLEEDSREKSSEMSPSVSPGDWCHNVFKKRFPFSFDRNKVHTGHLNFSLHRGLQNFTQIKCIKRFSDFLFIFTFQKNIIEKGPNKYLTKFCKWTENLIFTW